MPVDLLDARLPQTSNLSDTQGLGSAVKQGVHSVVSLSRKFDAALIIKVSAACLFNF